MNISWTEKITNEEVLRRRGTYILEKHITTTTKEGKTEGSISRGRPRSTWITGMTNSTGVKYHQLQRTADDQKRWHGLVVNLTQETTLRQGKVRRTFVWSSQCWLHRPSEFVKTQPPVVVLVRHVDECVDTQTPGSRYTSIVRREYIIRHDVVSCYAHNQNRTCLLLCDREQT